MSVRPRLLVSGAGIVGAVITLAVLLLPEIRIAQRAPSLHIVLETSAALIATLVAYLLLGRYRRRRLTRDLVLVWALLLLAVANLPLSAIPRSFLLDGERFATWLLLAVRLLGATGFAVAALLPERTLRPRRFVLPAVVAAVALVLGGALGVAAMEPDLALWVEPPQGPTTLDVLHLAAHPGIFVSQVAGFLLLAVAAVAFVRRAERDADEFLGWVAASATLAAFARIHYSLFPSLYTSWVYPGDALRLGGYLLLLIGAAREISLFWQARADAAVLEERRRIARDLHDGLAQELAFIVGQSHRLAAQRDGRNDAEMVASAAQRALDESRRAVAALSRPLDEPVEAVLAEEVEGVAARHDVRVHLDLQQGVHMPAEAREALLRVAREAVGNAARHSQAEEVTVTLRADDAIRLQVADEGVGFDPDSAARSRTRFGLISIRERVEALDGTVRIRSRPGSGTRVEVVLPPPSGSASGSAS